MSESNGTMDFDSAPEFAPREVRVTYKQQAYTLKQASAEVTRQYRNASARSVRMLDGKMVGLGDVGDVEMLLVAGCLFKDGKPMIAPQLKEWDGKVTKWLFEKAKAISPHLDEAADVETVDKQIATLQKQRERLLSGAEAEEAKN